MSARYFSLANLLDIAYEFGLTDGLAERSDCVFFFPPDTQAHAAYWDGYWAGVRFLHQITRQRRFICLFDSLEEANSNGTTTTYTSVQR